MTESASLLETPPSRLAERKAATATRLSTVARRLTAERGLTGFTIEELCDEVGVSRRTFFNYFPSKEEAVVGITDDDELGRFVEEFLARGSRGWSAVVDDLIELAASHARDAGLAEHADFITAVGREPKLLARFMDISREREQQLAELVATREGVRPIRWRAPPCRWSRPCSEPPASASSSHARATTSPPPSPTRSPPSARCSRPLPRRRTPNDHHRFRRAEG